MFRSEVKLEDLDEEARAFAMTDEEFREFIDKEQEVITKYLGTPPPCSDFAPKLHVYAKDSKQTQKHFVFVIVESFNTALEKSAIMFRIGEKVFEDNVITMALVMTCEAWSSTLAGGENRKYLLPEDDPDRKENLVMFACTMRGLAAMRTMPIVRDKDNNILPGEWTAHEGDVGCYILDHFWRGFTSKLPGDLRERMGLS